MLGIQMNESYISSLLDIIRMTLTGYNCWYCLAPVVLFLIFCRSAERSQHIILNQLKRKKEIVAFCMYRLTSLLLHFTEIQKSNIIADVLYIFSFSFLFYFFLFLLFVYS